MGTPAVCHKEFAVTSVNAILELYLMIVMVPMKCKIKFVEEEAVPLLSIPFRFFSFSDHSVVHV